MTRRSTTGRVAAGTALALALAACGSSGGGGSAAEGAAASISAAVASAQAAASAQGSATPAAAQTSPADTASASASAAIGDSTPTSSASSAPSAPVALPGGVAIDGNGCTAVIQGLADTSAALIQGDTAQKRKAVTDYVTVLNASDAVASPALKKATTAYRTAAAAYLASLGSGGTPDAGPLGDAGAEEAEACSTG